MIINSAFISHCPATIPEIGQDQAIMVKKTQLWLQQLKQYIYEKNIEHVMIVSGQTVPFVNSFACHVNEVLEGDFEYFGVSKKIHFHNNLKNIESLRQACRELGIKTESWKEKLDFGQLIALYHLQDISSIQSVNALHISMDSPLEHRKLGEIIALSSKNSSQKTLCIATADLSNQLNHKKTIIQQQAHNWNLEFMKIMKNDISKLSSLDPFLTEDISGAYPFRAASVLEGIMSHYLYLPQSWQYEEAFGVGYGSILYELE